MLQNVKIFIYRKQIALFRSSKSVSYDVIEVNSEGMIRIQFMLQRFKFTSF